MNPDYEIMAECEKQPSMIIVSECQIFTLFKINT